MPFLKTLTHALKAALLAAVAASSVPAQAQTGKPIRMVHTAAAGSMSDTFTRVVAEGLASRLQQAVIVDAKPGANGIIASQDVARSAPDGNTLLLGTMSSHVLNPILLNPPYDAVNDFAPVALLAITPLVLVANPSMPGNLDELLAVVRREPNKVSFATWGNATLPHLAAELLMSMTKTAMIHVPYKGAAPARIDVMAGRVSIMFSDMTGMHDVEAGRLKAIGVTGSTRAVAYPNVPTLAELGIRDYEALGWFAVYAPAATPKATVSRLSAEIAALLADPKFRKRIQDLGLDPQYGDSAQLASRMRNDYAKWARLIKEKSIRVE